MFKNKDGNNNLGKKPWIPQNPISESGGNKNSTWSHPDIVWKLVFHKNVGSSSFAVTDNDVKTCESDEFDLPDDDNDDVEFQSDDHSDVNVHVPSRELALLLEEELRQRKTSVVPPDDNDKWIGMENQELRDYFSSYDVKTVKHSKGHRGISAMVFEATVMGTWRLCFSVSIFLKKGRDRDAWERNPVRFNLEGIRKLYGYRAQKRDLDNFNQHSHGKSRLRFEMRLYSENVRNAAMHMSEDNQQLVWFKNEAAKYQKKTKALEEA
ncbi:hypothetical protein RND71_023492 [Anisodus tanguticus]|uniref:XS domain-containing protein n=1 Tax=Anisodus tanguticus TaxID=243964 RepID=A0AAE1RUY4_9SOLA|nr:hypothetical protein RND71_023492 [Anisodus tanguticus]